MNKTVALPTSLAEAIRYFADPEVSLMFLRSLRWPDGVACIACESKNVGFLKTRRIWKCRECHRQFSVKLGTIFEDSPIGLDKWLPALWMLANCKNGISSYELGRALKVTQKTAWFMLHRVRLAMQTKSFAKWDTETEADETFIGGKAQFMHKNKRGHIKKGGVGGKVAVLGLLQRGEPDRHSRVVASVVSHVRKNVLQKAIAQRVQSGTALYTDALSSYKGMDASYRHEVIDHAIAYVRGKVHTNGLENFWSLLKRAIKGTYVSVDPFHVQAYVDEQVHRFNNRKCKDAGRFVSVVAGIIGKRLTYRDLTGADLSPATT
jgi:transposase-like protein